jgi:hypothetical protein
MQANKKYFGPRGWAVLILAGGAALATPFMRAPRVAMEDEISESPLAKSRGSNTAFAAASFARPMGFDHLDRPAGRDDLPEIISPDAGDNLTPDFPSWASPPSRLDDLIAAGAAPPWSDSPTATTLPPMQPWMNRRLTHSTTPPTTASAPSHLPSSDTSNQFARRASPWDQPGEAARDPNSSQPIKPPPYPTTALPSTAFQPGMTGGSLTGATRHSSTSPGAVSTTVNPAAASSAAVGQAPAASGKRHFVYQPGLRP